MRSINNLALSKKTLDDYLKKFSKNYKKKGEQVIKIEFKKI